MGFDVNQTSDTDMAFDSDYWLAKRTSSTKNKVPESEQLCWAIDFPDWQTSCSANLPNRGAETYVLANKDSSVPFSTYNVYEPRFLQSDNYVAYRTDGLKPSTAYTISFWARTVTGVGSKLVVSSGTDFSLNSRVYLNNYEAGTLNSNWTRYSFTVNTKPNATTLGFQIGGGYQWQRFYNPNFLAYSEQINSWSSSGVTITPNTSYSVTNSPITPISDGADTLSFNSTNRYTYLSSIAAPEGTNTGGKTYTFSIWARVISGAPGILINGDGNVLPNGGSETNITPLDGGNVWKRYSVTKKISDNNISYRSIWTSIYSTTPNDVVEVWGAQLESGAVPTNYVPSTLERNESGVTNKMYGDLHYSGIQVEEGSSATAYEPVRSWSFKEYPAPIVIDDKIISSNATIYMHIPPGVTNSFISSTSYSTAPEDYLRTRYYGNVAQRSGLPQDAGDTVARYTDRQHIRDYRTYYASGNNVLRIGSGYLDGDSYRIVYPSDAVSMLVGSNYNYPVPPMGNSYIQFGPSEKDLGENANYNLYVKMYGTMFKVSSKAGDFKLDVSNTKVRGLTFHQKNTGNGKRRYVSTSLRENTDGKIYFSQHSPLFQMNNKTGIAEIEGVLIPAYAGKFQTNARNSDFGNRVSDGFPQAVENCYAGSFNKSIDLFSFMQGSSEGFVYMLNVNSTFINTMVYADTVNAPFPNDNGNLYTRQLIGRPGASNNLEFQYYWYGHGPYMGIEPYGPSYGNVFKGVTMTDTYSSVYGNYINPLAEILGEDFYGTNANSLIQQQHASYANAWAASARGQVKNFYMMNATGFSGQIGDLLIGKDASKYFHFFKQTGSPSNVAMFVKV